MTKNSLFSSFRSQLTLHLRGFKIDGPKKKKLSANLNNGLMN